MSVEREIDSLDDRLTRLEEKVDKLLDFRGWVLGAVAGVAAVVSGLFAVLTAYLNPRP